MMNVQHETEKRLLGSLILGGGQAFCGVDLKPTDFTVRANQLIFTALCKLNMNEKPIHLVTLRDELKKHQLLPLVGDVKYLVELAESVPCSSDAEYYAQIITEAARAREGQNF